MPIKSIVQNWHRAPQISVEHGEDLIEHEAASESIEYFINQLSSCQTWGRWPIGLGIGGWVIGKLVEGIIRYSVN